MFVLLKRVHDAFVFYVELSYAVDHLDHHRDRDHRVNHPQVSHQHRDDRVEIVDR